MPGICLDKSSFSEVCSNSVTRVAEIIPIQPDRPVAIDKIDIKEVMNYSFQEGMGAAFDAEVLQKLESNQRCIDVMTCAVDVQLQQTQKQLEVLQNRFSKL